MMIPNNYAYVSRRSGNDLYGQPIFSQAVRVECAVVHLNKKSLKTSVRADSSASRGSADEFTSMSKILFSTNVIIVVEDRVTIAGFTLKVSGIEPRYAVTGRHDHNEVDLENWV